MNLGSRAKDCDSLSHPPATGSLLPLAEHTPSRCWTPLPFHPLLPFFPTFGKAENNTRTRFSQLPNRGLATVFTWYQSIGPGDWKFTRDVTCSDMPSLNLYVVAHAVQYYFTQVQTALRLHNWNAHTFHPPSTDNLPTQRLTPATRSTLVVVI